MTSLLPWAIGFAQGCVMLAILFCVLRLLRGPSAQDRVLALDTLWMCIMLFALSLGIRFGSDTYFDLALLIALTGFVSTLGLAKFLLRGEIIE